MPAPTGWADLDIQAALVDLVLNMPGDPVVPVATLTADAPAGSLTLTVDSTTTPLRMPQGGVLQFDDGEDERAWLIAHVDATTIMLSAAGMGQAGLTSTHPAGTRVWTNLYADAVDPEAMVLMFAHGLPVISFATRQTAMSTITMGGIANASQRSASMREGIVIVRCWLQVRLTDPTNKLIDPAVWGLEQIKTQRTTIARIEDEVLANPLLITDRFPSQTRGVGGGGQPAIVKEWTQGIDPNAVQIATAYMDITYRTT